MKSTIRIGLVAVVALLLSLQLGRAAIAQTPAPEPPSIEPDCDPCVVVIDQPAWDETQTIVDRDAFDEALTVVDVPASTGTRTIVDAPARSVAHHDLVSPATTVARQVLVTAGYYQTVATLVPGHYEWGLVWTPSGYWTQAWVSSGYWTQQWVSSGYWTWQWTTSGYWGQQWVSSGYYSTVYVPSGYWSYQWVSTGGHWEYDCDDICVRSWEPDGYYATTWIDTSYYTSVWNDTSHYESRWYDTSHWQTVWTDSSHWESVWIDTSHYDQRWADTSSWQWGGAWVGDRYITAATYVPSGYMGFRCYWDDGERTCDNVWISTAYTAYPNQVWVAPVYTTVYDPVPAVYNDWIEQIAAVTHTETYTIPAVTHQTTVHHTAVTHTVVIHHAAVTHFAQAPAGVSQSSQGSTTGTSSGTTTSPSGSPVTIPIVSTVTLVDQPASTRAVTVVDSPAWDETRVVVDHAAYDEQVTTWVPDVSTQLNTTSGAMITTFVPAVTTEEWVPYTCYWDVDDSGTRYRECDGGYYVVTPAHWETSWHQGHYVVETQRECDDDGLHCYSTRENVWYEGPFWEIIDRSRWVTSTVHHDAVTHSETIHHAAVTHTETVTKPLVTHTENLRIDASIANDSPGTNEDGLEAFAFLAGMTALAGAGRYASKADALRVAVSEMAHLGKPIPAALTPILADTSDQTVASVEESIVNVLTDTTTATLDPGTSEYARQVDAMPDGRTTAVARRQFDEWLFNQRSSQYSYLPDAIAAGGPGPTTGTENGVVRFGLGFLKSVTDAAVDMVAGTFKTAWAAEEFWFKTQTDPFGAARDVKDLVDHRNDIGRSFFYGLADSVDRIGTKLDSGDPGEVGEALGSIFVFSAAAATVVEGGAGLLRAPSGAAALADGAVVTDGALIDAGTSSLALEDATAVRSAFNGARPVLKGQWGEQQADSVLARVANYDLQGSQVTVDTSAGRVRLDRFATYDDNPINVEIKTGANARASANQTSNWADLADSGGTAVGGNAEAAGVAGDTGQMPTVIVRVADDGSVVAELATGGEEFAWAQGFVDAINDAAVLTE